MNKSSEVCVCVCVQALCAAVASPNVLQTMELVFSGADVMCATGDPAASTPYLLAQRAGQRLQMEFLHHNKLTGEPTTAEIPLKSGGADAPAGLSLCRNSSKNSV